MARAVPPTASGGPGVDSNRCIATARNRGFCPRIRFLTAGLSHRSVAAVALPRSFFSARSQRGLLALSGHAA
eukprot:2623583-Prymnesium_polylepis.1